MENNSLQDWVGKSVVVKDVHFDGKSLHIETTSGEVSITADGYTLDVYVDDNRQYPLRCDSP